MIPTVHSTGFPYSNWPWLFPWGVTFAAAATARVRQWLLQRREREEASVAILRIASDVTKMADRVDADLSRLAGDFRWRAYRERCARLRQRADAALAHADSVRLLSLVRLRRALNRFQRDMRELRRFRLELQAEIAHRSHPDAGVRAARRQRLRPAADHAPARTSPPQLRPRLAPVPTALLASAR